MEFTEKQRWVALQAEIEAIAGKYVAVLALDVHGWGIQLPNPDRWSGSVLGDGLTRPMTYSLIYPKFIIYTDVARKVLITSFAEGENIFGDYFYKSDIGMAVYTYFRDAYGAKEVELRPEKDILGEHHD